MGPFFTGPEIQCWYADLLLSNPIVRMCISILKGFTLFFPKEEEIRSLEEGEEMDQVLQFLLHSIKAQMLIQSCRLEESLPDLTAAIHLMTVISIENTEIMYGILLTILSLYNLFEKDILPRKESNSSRRRVRSILRNISKLNSKKTSNSASVRSSLNISEILDRNDPTFESDMMSTSLNSSKSKSIEFSKPPEVNVSNSVHIYAGQVSKILASMPCHFLIQKLHILIRALEKRSDPLFVSFAINAVREETKRLCQEKDSKTKYLAIIFLVKNSKLYEKSDESRILAEQICTANKIQTCLSIL